MLLRPPTKSAMLTDIIVAKTAPPKVISADGRLTKYPKPLIPPAESIIPYKTRTKHTIIPTKDAISTFTHPFFR